jgi:hypothetical protein
MTSYILLDKANEIMTYHRVCNKSNTTGATSGAGTANPGLSSVRVAQSLVYVVFSRLLLGILSLLFWSWYCLSFDLRLLITSLAS